jgi:nitroreductase
MMTAAREVVMNMTSTSANTDLITRAVAVAGRAPSLHNSQPWLWVADGTQLQLYLDHSRVIRHTDNSGREALISCGAMLDHLRVALAAAGWHVEVNRFPDRGNAEHLATVHVSRRTRGSEELRFRADAILRRRTDRLPFLPPDNWELLEPTLRALLDGGTVRLDVVPDALRGELTEASRLTEAMRRFDSDYHAEIDWWTGPFELGEDIPRSALNSVSESDRVEVNRVFPAGAHRDRRLDVRTDQGRILVLSTPADTRSDALACGEALSMMLLECTAARLATCTVTHVTETQSGREVVAELIGRTGRPQVLIRVGRIPELDPAPVPTPRRHVADVLRFRR